MGASEWVVIRAPSTPRDVWAPVEREGMPKLASARFLSVLEAVGATAWRSFDLDLFDRAGKLVPGYSGALQAAGADQFEIWER